MLKDCYKCRGLFETDDPDRRYCDDCLEELVESGKLVRFPGSGGPLARLQDWLADVWDGLRDAVSGPADTGRGAGPAYGGRGQYGRPRSRGTSAYSGRRSHYGGTADWDLFARLTGSAFVGAVLGHAATIYLDVAFLGTVGGVGGLYWAWQRFRR